MSLLLVSKLGKSISPNYTFKHTKKSHSITCFGRILPKLHANLIRINWKIQVFGDIMKVSQNRGAFSFKFIHSQRFFLD